MTTNYASSHFEIDIELIKAPEGYWIATHRTLRMHGTGETVAAALFDFLSVAAETYADLESSERILGLHLQEQLKELRSLGNIYGVGSDE